MDEEAVGRVSDALALAWSRVGTRIRMSVELDAYMAERLAMSEEADSTYDEGRLTVLLLLRH